MKLTLKQKKLELKVVMRIVFQKNHIHIFKKWPCQAEQNYIAWLTKQIHYDWVPAFHVHPESSFLFLNFKDIRRQMKVLEIEELLNVFI